jgi:oxalate decarboxylase/phosphoglucose isomerase-like protein (cupin superfamily)
MVDTAGAAPLTAQSTGIRWDEPTAHDQWMASVGIPIHRGFYIEDARTVELGWWAERQCSAAFLQLTGLEGVSELRVTEIPAGASLAPVKFGMDEIVYGLSGRGLTTLTWDNGESRTFEWESTSMFLVPRNCTYQLSNTQGNAPARVMQCNYLPLALATVGDPDAFFKSSLSSAPPREDEFSEAKSIVQAGDEGGPVAGVFWYGNFFPNMRTWDHLTPFRARGAGGHVVWVKFPRTPLTAHMSVFPSRTYKKGHRHGPGWVIVIPAGEGYSIMWQEGHEKVIIPWHEGTVFVPPGRWFHQHFNLGADSARYVALHPPLQLQGFSEKIEDMERDQIEYVNEDPMIRQRFESELGTRGLSTLMPSEAYADRGYQWGYES